tara:strand:- start:2835 stop:3491 length:657 start_codon:yes stop_codon:yes gene_type:complete
MDDTPVRIYTDGIFDLFHYGHANCLKQIKEMYPHTTLIVGVCNDKDTIMFKGLPVMNENERYDSLKHCKWVDEIIKNAPWTITPEFIELHNIEYVAHDALPYQDASGCSEDGDCYGWLKKEGLFRETQRTQDISTSCLILRIIKNYNEYVMRNLSRGYTRNDIGISLLKEKRIQMKFKLYNITRKLWKKQNEFYDNVLEKILQNIIDFIDRMDPVIID